uniref:Uncharacterized protein n=1 Tax=Colletotrichum fructicola (strain Nara gc5) TaxID=1213859 RepID=L2FYP7_COLFN
MVTLLPSLWPCPDLKKVSLHAPESLSSWFNMPFSTYLVQASVAALLVVLGVHMQTTAAQVTPPTCTNVDQPNPLWAQHPNNATGVLNVTMAIFPIPMAAARQMAGHDHDIRFQDFGIPDFSKAGYEFPFLDLLGDGTSNFRWAPEQLISETNPAAVTGSQAYGTTVHAATFAPDCNAYSALSTCSGSTYFNGSSAAGDKRISLTMRRAAEQQPIPYTLSMFDSIINQPIFANGTACDQQIRLFNTSLSQGAFAPVPVRGSVATPFIENNYLPCDMFRAYNPVKTT